MQTRLAEVKSNITVGVYAIRAAARVPTLLLISTKALRRQQTAARTVSTTPGLSASSSTFTASSCPCLAAVCSGVSPCRARSAGSVSLIFLNIAGVFSSWCSARGDSLTCLSDKLSLMPRIACSISTTYRMLNGRHVQAQAGTTGAVCKGFG